MSGVDLFKGGLEILLKNRRWRCLAVGKLTSFLYKLARTSNDISKITSGNPKKIANRAKNKVLGRKVASKMFKSMF